MRVHACCTTVQARGIAALHARKLRVKTPNYTQFTRALRARNSQIRAGACKKIHAILYKVRVNFTRSYVKVTNLYIVLLLLLMMMMMPMMMIMIMIMTMMMMVMMMMMNVLSCVHVDYTKKCQQKIFKIPQDKFDVLCYQWLTLFNI